MAAQFDSLSISCDGARGAILVSAQLRNQGPSPWREADGFAFGFHRFDPETETLLDEGPHQTTAEDVAPGASAAIAVEVPLPSEPGRHRIFVSALRGEQGWDYMTGSPFLMIDALVDTGGPRIERALVTTRRRVSAERLLRTWRRGLTLPFASLWEQRKLIASMAGRDIRSRYRGSFLGAFWTILSPLLLMMTYYFVFGVVLQSRFPGDPSHAGFVLYFLAGLIPWLPFAEAAARAPSIILEHRNFVKKMVFPLVILPVNIVIAALSTAAVLLAGVLAMIAAVRGALPVELLWLPLLLAPQVLFTLGICWFSAALGTFVRDFIQVNGFLLTLWFFLTPICYPESSLPPGAAAILERNPVYWLVRGYRMVLLEHTAPPVALLLKLWLVSLAVFLGGHALFYRVRKSFADVV